MPAELLRRGLEDDARRLDGKGRQRKRRRARWLPGIDRMVSGDAEHLLGARVIRLEIGVGDRPIGEAGTADGAEQTALAEVELAKAPEIRREVHTASTDAPAIDEI